MGREQEMCQTFHTVSSAPYLASRGKQYLSAVGPYAKGPLSLRDLSQFETACVSLTSSPLAAESLSIAL